ncbi:MAG: hypothetical protein Q8M74_02585 [Chloroflexota bacterium]|nr:hypothetical protein [Chloroflexota bacterium]
MTDRHDDLVDAFLADLGSARAPEDLPASVMWRVRDERLPRVVPPAPWLALAAVIATAVLVLTGLAWIVAGPGPSPTPADSPEPTATQSATATALPVPLGSWDITLAMADLDRSVTLMVVDFAGTMTGVAQATVALPFPGPEDPYALDIGPGSDTRSLTIGWTGGVCDERARLELAPDGRTLSLRFPPRPGCDAMGIGFAVELRFKDPVDPAAFVGTWADDAVAAADVNLRLTAFRDWQRGFVGGQTPAGDAIILETSDGGATWRVGGLGLGEVTAIGVTPDGRAWAGKACPDETAACSGLYRYDDGGWGKVDNAWPVSLSFAADVGAGLFRVADGPRNDVGIPTPELRLMDDGEVWSAVENPCPTTMQAQDVSRIDASTVVVLCESEGFTGNSFKELHRSTDGGLMWTRLADGPYSGTGMGMDLLADGTGWMWGDRSPLLATTDGGVTWISLDVADGDVRMVGGADGWGLGAGVVLIRDQEQAPLLLVTGDGATSEMSTWTLSCCGG